MKDITAIGFKLVGGSSHGSLVAHFPKTKQELLDALKEAKEFLMNSDTKWIQVQLINREGKKELHNLYKSQLKKEAEATNDCVDPYKWAHYA